MEESKLMQKSKVKGENTMQEMDRSWVSTKKSSSQVPDRERAYVFYK